MPKYIFHGLIQSCFCPGHNNSVNRRFIQKIQQEKSIKYFAPILQGNTRFSFQNNLRLNEFLDAMASPSTYPSQSVAVWVMFSDFGDSYRIYRACELVIMKLVWHSLNICFCSSSSLFVIRQPLISELPALIFFILLAL